jgi:hypothetical protein
MRPPPTHFSRLALFFYLSFQFLILYFSVPVCTQFRNLLFGRPLSRRPSGLLLNT